MAASSFGRKFLSAGVPFVVGKRFGVDAVLDRNGKSVESAQSGPGATSLVSGACRLQHHLAIQRAEGIQAHERRGSV